MQIRLGFHATVEAEDVREVCVHGDSGTVTVRMADGVVHYCSNDRGLGAWDTATRLANDITRARVRIGKDEVKPVAIAA
jgi:hypothetical protein